MGRLTIATIVDHVLPRAERPDLEWDWDNFAALCRSHHNAKTGREQASGAKG